MHKDLQRSKKQYPMIEELIVRGKPLTGSRFKQIDGNSFTPTDIITATEIRLSGAQTLSQLMRFTRKWRETLPALRLAMAAMVLLA